MATNKAYALTTVLDTNQNAPSSGSIEFQYFILAPDSTLVLDAAGSPQGAGEVAVNYGDSQEDVRKTISDFIQAREGELDVEFLP